jgi:hypothetical protein
MPHFPNRCGGFSRLIHGRRERTSSGGVKATANRLRPMMELLYAFMGSIIIRGSWQTGKIGSQCVNLILPVADKGG